MRELLPEGTALHAIGKHADHAGPSKIAHSVAEKTKSIPYGSLKKCGRAYTSGNGETKWNTVSLIGARRQYRIMRRLDAPLARKP
jgi:hypothetical protein